MKYLFLVFVLIQVSCGTGVEEKSRGHKVAPNGFGAYLDMFLAEAKEQGKPIHQLPSLTIEFAELPSPTVGRCTIQGRTSLVQIDSEYWKEANYIQRVNLMYHELGHCILERGHVEHLSIMLPSVLYTNTFISNEKELLEELYDEDEYGSIYNLTTREDKVWTCGGHE